MLHTGKQQSLFSCLKTGILFLLLTLSAALAAALPASAAVDTPAGTYCPGSEILLISAEELSAALKLGITSQDAFNNKDIETALNTLNSAGTALQLAASRGSSARTNLIIDTIIQSKQTEDYAQMLHWFPLLEKSIQSMQSNPTVDTATTLIAQTRATMEGKQKGDPVKQLKNIRHILACDALDNPLQQALQSQAELLKQIPSKTAKPDYKTLLDPIKKALSYSLGSRI